MQERTDLTRQALTLAAAKTFDHGGYERATMLEIRRTAAVSKGLTAFHFGSKEELADEVRRQAYDRTCQATAALRSSCRPALQRLIDLTHLAAVQLAEDHFTRAAVHLARQSDTPDTAHSNPLVFWRKVLGDAAGEAHSDGVLRGRVSIEFIAELASRLAFGEAASQDAQAARHSLTSLWEGLLPYLTDAPEGIDCSGCLLPERPVAMAS